MARYRWHYVESGTVKKTLTLVLTYDMGHTIVREGKDINYAYQLEQSWKARGDTFVNSIDDFLDEQKAILEERQSFYLIRRVSQSQLKKYLQTGDYDK